MGARDIRSLLNGLLRDAALDPRDSALVDALTSRWIELEPDGFFQWWSENRFPFGDPSRTRELFGSWGERSLEDASKAISELPVRFREDALGMVRSKLVMSDPEHALRLARQSGKNRVGTLIGVYIVWAEHDPKGAILGLAGESDSARAGQWPNLRATILGSVFARLAKTDPAAASALVGEVFGVGQARDSALANIAIEVAKDSPLEGLELLAGIGSRDISNSYHWGIITKWVKTDPAAVLRWADKLPNGPDRWRSIRLAAGRLINDGELDIDDVLGELPSNSLRAELVGEVVSGMTDLTEAVAWAEALEDDGLRRDAGRRAFRRLAIIEPEAAFQLAAADLDTFERDGRLELAVRHMPHNASEAGKLILNLPLEARAPVAKGWIEQNRTRVSESDRKSIEQLVTNE